MRIDRVEIYPLTGMRYRRLWRNAKGVQGGPDQMRWSFNVVVRIRTDDGAVGWGEVGPNNPYQNETTWSVVAALERFYAPALVGRDPWDIGPLHRAMEALLPGNPHARTAIDLALHDLAGKSAGQPVWALLGGRCHRRIPVKFPLSQTENAAEAVDQARQLVAETGTRYLKVKIGPIDRLRADVALIEALRDAFGSDLAVQVDANASYATVAQAATALRQMLPYGLALVEQPLPRWQLDGIAELRSRFDVPVMVDESCWSPQDAFAALGRRAADVVNVKVAKAGGLFHSRQIAAVAAAAGADIFVGSTTETGVGAAAGLHLYAATPNVWPVTACMFGPWLLVDDMLTAPTRLRCQDGAVEVPSTPGLGVEVDEAALERFAPAPVVVDEPAS
ncbi:mandelate racemase/muconate lactonizing enzyme family protein [Phytohabitans suffuscus]|uniref:N-succinyl-L-Arg/Lys racemase n=1 Tax=Phytohabitans suffuscus TaxID=624315 RepID=A0A6F8YEP3_9ACTN|nr:enolase C-terminal domain-like protein [Phytohabitans suffuscus]BCB84537.1 N-succinyl-L-Arg/Lys racemase [Phytohabitans suffuscus]